MLPVLPLLNTKKFLCLTCQSRFEEEIYDEINQDIFCLACGDFNILPFAESATGQHGCGSTHCHRRMKQGTLDCVNCKHCCA